MIYRIERDAAMSIGVNFETTRSIFDLSSENQDVFDALVRRAPQVEEALEAIQRRIPLPKSAIACVQGRFYRLPNHNRSFCYSVSDSVSIVDSPAVVVKGSEPLLQDFERMIDWMLQAPLRTSSRVMADHFPLAEGKIPGALSAREAMHEAQIALDVQKRHLMHYGDLATIPVPLLVHSISQQGNEACIALLREKLSQSAFERIDPLLQKGLAIYVYYYPSPPIRANFMGDLGMPGFGLFSEKKHDEHSVVSKWAQLLIRLLYLGYLPYNVRNDGLGACMDFGNAAVDGGFCDPDSIIAVDGRADDEFFYESVIQSFKIFQNTVERFLGLSDTYSLYPSIESFACWQYIHHLLKDAVATEGRPGLQLDPRFLKVMSPASVSDIRSCALRKSRVGAYTYFAKRYINGVQSTNDGIVQN
jgi:hypothetical protein